MVNVFVLAGRIHDLPPAYAVIRIWDLSVKAFSILCWQYTEIDDSTGYRIPISIGHEDRIPEGMLRRIGWVKRIPSTKDHEERPLYNRQLHCGRHRTNRSSNHHAIMSAWCCAGRLHSAGLSKDGRDSECRENVATTDSLAGTAHWRHHHR